MGKKDKSGKRKSRESDIATDTGTGSDILLDKSNDGYKDMDVIPSIDDLNEPTMGEKLAGLNLTESDETAKFDNVGSTLVKPPSADSIFILLKQALRADDRALLIDCLFRQDEKVIANSLSLLNPSDVIKFLQSLISIIQLRGAVVACTLPWLRTLLLQHAGSIMSQESSLAALNSLYQLIESRVSNFSQALQLSSSLDLLYAETIDEEEENDKITPVIYEDNDDSDEAESDDSMEVESVHDDGEPQVYEDNSDDEDDGDVSN